MAKRRYDGSIVLTVRKNKRKAEDISSKMNKKLRIVEYWHQLDLNREERAKYMASICIIRINKKE